MTTTTDRALVAQLAPPHPTPLATLRSRLATAAHDRGLLDVAYSTVDSPVGALLIAVTDDGVVRVAFEREDHDAVLRELATSISPRVLQSRARTDAVERQLDEYFARGRRRFEVPVDLRLVSGFRRTAISHLADIAYGATASYAALAAAAGNPTAVRAAASACSHNPVPIVLPCHRVIRSDGRIGDYRGGSEAKAALLELERAA
jgi:methylated-DNA-[protein]-cysteine S-methyltransferase